MGDQIPVSRYPGKHHNPRLPKTLVAVTLLNAHTEAKIKFIVKHVTFMTQRY